MPTPKIDPRRIREAYEALSRCNGNQVQAARMLKIARSTLQNRLRASDPPKFDQHASKIGKSLNDFRAAHDKDYIVPKRIKAAIEKLGHAWEYESDFTRLAGVGPADLALYRDEFTDYWLQVERSGKRVWTGSKALAEQMRAMVR